MDKKNNINLTEGVIWKQLLKFVWPIILANVFQQLYNITNSMIVGNYISTDALSAVSSTSSITQIASYIFYGISTAIGILVSNSFGAKDQENLKKTVETGLFLAVVGGILMTVLGELFTPQLMRFSNIRESIYHDAEVYLRIFMLGYTPVFLYNSSFFIMRSLGDSRHPLYYLMFSCLLNIVLGVVTVRYLNWGVVGVALSTVLSQVVVDIFALRSLFAMNEDFRIKLREYTVSFDYVKKMLQLGIPASIQNMLIAFSIVVVQSQINLFPNAAIAGIGVATKVAVWAQIPMQSISTIGTSYVGQNLGARKYDRVKSGIRICNIIASIITLISAIIISLNAEFFVGLFNDNPDVVLYGAKMVRFSAFSFVPLTWSHIYNGCCRGAGNMLVPMIIAVTTQCVFKYLFVVYGLKIDFNINIIYLSDALTYTLAGLAATAYFHLSPWTKKAHLR